MVLVQEWCSGGDVFEHVANLGGVLSERNAVNTVLHPFLQSLQYLHMHGIAHRCVGGVALRPCIFCRLNRGAVPRPAPPSDGAAPRVVQTQGSAAQHRVTLLTLDWQPKPS